MPRVRAAPKSAMDGHSTHSGIPMNRHLMNDQAPDSANVPAPSTPLAADRPEPAQKPQEIGGPRGLEPTRFGDWERKGRCIDF